ncbi:MAG: NifU family protein [Cytophagales bacterium]|nr:NifU family protein [Cytophagales bacterium]
MENTLAKRPVTVYMETVPNPNSLKYVANFMLVPDGLVFDFPDASSAKDAPLAQALFQFPFVNRVFYMSNFVTITKVEQVAWDDIQQELRDFVKNWLEEGKLLIKENFSVMEAQTEKSALAQANLVSEGDTEAEAQIKSILEEYIKPAVEQDGGAISFHSFEDGVVRVLLQGSCSGCPSSTITLKAGIERLLMSQVPGIKAVEALDA